MPNVVETDSRRSALRAARALQKEKIFGKVTVHKRRPYDDIGRFQYAYAVWVENDQGGVAAAVVQALFKGGSR